MSRIFWDSMLFIYLLEDHPVYFARTEYLLDRSNERGDQLFTSYLALGEILAGAEKSGDPSKASVIRSSLDELGFSYLEFGAAAVQPFSRLRGQSRLRIADSIHLACAAGAGIDMFLTGDQQLVGMYVPGIQFIADFETPVI
jgi:predicted nucleic acid-binding protein